MPSAKANINPDLLTFSRERFGYDIPAIAGKLRVKEEKWVQWEKGEEKPTTNQLIQFAGYLDRTPAFFYLNNQPVEEMPFSEFRTINNKMLETGSPKLIRAIREAKRNRMTLIDLYEDQNKRPVQIPVLDPSEDIRVQAMKVREWLGMLMDTQKSWRSSSEALTQWKNCIEEKDIYVVQFPFVDVDECRGFAIAEDIVPIIGINSKDSYNARIFTLIHELVHILFRDSVRINDSLSEYFNSGRKLEQTCNRLAAEILVPAEELRFEFDDTKKLSEKLRG